MCRSRVVPQSSFWTIFAWCAKNRFCCLSSSGSLCVPALGDPCMFGLVFFISSYDCHVTWRQASLQVALGLCCSNSYTRHERACFHFGPFSLLHFVVRFGFLGLGSAHVAWFSSSGACRLASSPSLARTACRSAS